MTRATTYNGYFRARNVTPQTYEEYVLPRHLADILPTDKNSPILDIGCGYCQMLESLRRLGFTILRGVDMSADAVQQGLRASLHVSLIDDLEEFIWTSEARYDLVIMSHVIEHIDKQRIIEILRLIRTRLLSSAGALYLATPNAQSPTNSYWAYEDFTHTTIFTSGSILYVLRQAGFESITFLDPDGVNYLSGTKKATKRILQALYRVNKHFWNRVMSDSYHRSSPEIYAWELRVLAR